MKINPINNTMSFGAKIPYNDAMEQGFVLAKKCTNSTTKKDLDYAKGFINGIRTISADTSRESVEILPNFTLGKPSDGYNCIEEVKKKASELLPQKHELLEKMSSELNEAINKVYELKEKYSMLLVEELDKLQLSMKK